MKSLRVVAAMLAIACSGGVYSVAQETPTQATRAIDGTTHETLISIYVPEMLNAPFSAVVRTEWVKRLGDGATITTKNHRVVARDASGKIFQERRLLTPTDDRQQSPLTQTELYDPAKSIRIDCDARNRCQAYKYHWPNAEVRRSAATPRESVGAPRATFTREDLGTQTMEGFDVTGTRETSIIEAGEMGNDRPLTIVKEFWYSPVLQMNLLTIRDDPRFGLQTFRVTNISTVTPDPALFVLPPSAKVSSDSNGH